MDRRGKQPEDLTGRKFGKLTPLNIVERPQRGTYWQCRCDCGRTTVALASNLKGGNTKSCGCLANGGKLSMRQRSLPAKPIIPSNRVPPSVAAMIGRQYGKLTIVEFVGRKGAHGMVKCQCACGNTTIARAASIKQGDTTSCGCVRSSGKAMLTHGDSKKDSLYYRLYRIWCNMRERCENPNSDSAQWYADHGVTVCEEWHDWLAFKSWSLSHGYRDDLTIDRIDPFGNYCPENCRWTTPYIQANNHRNSRMVTVNGKTTTLMNWCLENGYDYEVARIEYDIDHETQQATR